MYTTGLITQPKPLPSELKYVPDHGEAHAVATGESWWTLAELPLVRQLHMSAGDLCYFNFKTRNPREINWYLHHKVGCRLLTHDRKNYMFSSADRFNKDAASPGIVYLPAAIPVHRTAPKVDEPRLDMWVGLGVKGGTMFAVAGIETMEGLAVGIDQPHKWMALQASTTRLGLGWGASGGVCLIVVTGVREPSELTGFMSGGGDFTLALGENWDKIAKARGAAKKFMPIMDVIAKIGAKTPHGLKTALKAEPDRYGDLVKAVMQFRETIGCREEQNVYLVDIPWLGTGAEASLFHGVATFTALWDSG